MDFIKVVLPIIITVIINATLSNIIFYHKKKLITNVIVWVVMIVVITFISQHFHIFFKRNIIALYLLGATYLLGCFYLYKNNYTQITFVFFTIWSTSSMVSSICLYLAHLYFSNLSLQYQNMVKLILFILIYSIIILLVKHKMVENIKNILGMFNKKFLIFTLFPILCFIVFVAIFNPYSIDNITYSKLITMMMYVSIVIFAYYFVFSTFLQISEKTKIEEKLKVLQVHKSLQNDYYDVLKKHIENVNMIRHDNRHHYVAIQRLSTSKNFKELNDYIKSLISKYDDFELPRVCENSSVNAILSYYFDCAKKSNITTKFQISIPSNINIDSIDLNVIFGNCLENAIDACLKLTGEKQKYLNIKAAIVNNYFVIDMSNSFNGFIDAQEDIFFSTKSDAANHGIGLESVKNLVSQYSGTISLAYSENEFRTSIMMHNGPSS